MRVDARDLRRDVSAQSQRAPGQLVHELERLQVEVVTRAGQQRVDIFEQRRHDELVAVHREEIEHVSPAGARSAPAWGGRMSSMYSGRSQARMENSIRKEQAAAEL